MGEKELRVEFMHSRGLRFVTLARAVECVFPGVGVTWEPNRYHSDFMDPWMLFPF